MTQTNTTSVKKAKKIAAIKIYNRVMASKNATRANALKQMIEKAGLTPGGASTYYANIKNGVPGWSLAVASATKEKVKLAKSPSNKTSAKKVKPESKKVPDVETVVETTTTVQ